MTVQHFIYYKIVKIIDIFQFSNVYRSTKKLAKFALSTKKQEKCLLFLRIEIESK